MEFKCKSMFKPTVVWNKGDATVAESDRIKLLFTDEGNQVYRCAMEIKEPTKDKDAGQFICTVSNQSGKLTATFTVKFEGVFRFCAHALKCP
jgi:hypothetical protein